MVGGTVPFAALGLPAPILKGVRAAGYTEPTPIQRKAIPLVLEGRDVIGAAQTGSGAQAPPPQSGTSMPQFAGDDPIVKEGVVDVVEEGVNADLASQGISHTIDIGAPSLSEPGNLAAAADAIAVNPLPPLPPVIAVPPVPFQ